MKLTAPIAVCALAMFGAIVLGCGDETSATAQEVNADCRQANSKAVSELTAVYTGAEGKRFQNPRETVQFEAENIVPVLLADAEAQVESIRSLEVPEQKQEQGEAIVAAYEDWIARANSEPAQVVSDNDVFEKGRTLAGKYGLVQCGLDPFEPARE